MSGSPILAKLAYLTNPESGKHVLNIQFQGDDFAMQIQINETQLSNLLADGSAALAFKKSNTSLEPA